MVIMMDLITYCRFEEEFKYYINGSMNPSAMCQESIKKNP